MDVQYRASLAARRAEWVLRGYRLKNKYRDFTMVWRYASNISILRHLDDPRGCVVECGVWRGGMIAGIADTLGPDREYHLFDSFEGLPPPTELDGAKAQQYVVDVNSVHYHDNCAAEMGFAQRAMRLSRGRKVKFHPGWFADTLPEFQVPDAGIAVLRVDADWYEPTLECLEALYPHVNRGGLIILDDYGHWDGCNRAVHRYLADREQAAFIQAESGVAFIKVP